MFPQQDYPGRNVSYPRRQAHSCSPHSRTVNSFFSAYVCISVACINAKHGDWMIILFHLGKEVHEKSQTRLRIAKLCFELGTAEYGGGVPQGLRHCSVHLRKSVECLLKIRWNIWKNILYKEPTRCNFGSIVY